ncbi:MAG: S41 family peptidase [Bacteroidaceae bacterium]|nr:S41 family peptidase [Bacteroidaceae bacterium]
MVSKKHYIVLIAAIMLLVVSCVPENEFENTPKGNFNALWTIIDERYCFLDYKNEEYGLDWDKVRKKYSSRLTSDVNNIGLFEILTDMLSELRDGHVNLYYTADVGRYWSWKEDYPANFDMKLVEKYLGTDYKISSGIYYKVLDDNIGYLYVGDFSNTIGESSLDAIISMLSVCNGLIIDVRDNGGGSVENARTLASRFTNKDVFVGYIMHKTGPGHSEFSEPEKRYIETNKYHLRWQKPVVVLANRGSYSATNSFVSDMKCLPLVTVMGDVTGGGSGMPMSSALPNGWSVRFSASPMLDADGNHIEFGVAPDIAVSMDKEAACNGIDSIIEAARNHINSLLQ